MLLNDLVGTWFLQEWDCTLNGDFHNYPFGKRAKGTISYSPGGRMSAVLMKADRKSIAIPNLIQASDEEKLAAVDGYVSYAGDWRVEQNQDGKQVIHSVDFSLLPNWVGTDLIRTISWTKAFSAADEPAQLVLSTAPHTTRSGKVVVNRLRWKMK